VQLLIRLFRPQTRVKLLNPLDWTDRWETKQREDYRKRIDGCGFSPTAKRFSPTTSQTNFTRFVRWRIQFNPGCFQTL